MFFGWEEVAVMYTFKQLLFYTATILAMLGVLLYGILQIVKDNSQLRQENEALRKRISRIEEENRARNKKPS